MTDIGYIIAGYAITAVALGGYWFRLILRTRRAEQPIPPEERAS